MKKLHFIGAGGSGMSGLVKYALASGYEVTGSDAAQSEAVTELRNLGLEIADNHSSSLLRGADTVIYSSAIKSDNFEFQFAKDMKKELLHRSEFLAQITKNHKTIAVGGSHGKTTTSAMITFILNELKLRPSAIIGGKMRFNHSNHLVGSGDLFVIEADESDGSFLNYQPFISVVTNIGLDHLDHHQNIDGLKSSFKSFIKNTDVDGGVILGWDNHYIREIADNLEQHLISFGFKVGCDLRLLSLKTERGQLIFDLILERDRLHFTLPLIGRHNALNALAAIGVCRLLGLPIQKCIVALQKFSGVDRRLNTLLESEGLLILDDYAHNPDKISACIESVKENWPERYLHVAFQPHRYSRLISTWHETALSFKFADYVYLFPVYSAGESKPHDFDISALARDIKNHSGKSVSVVESFDNIVEIYDNNRSANDTFLTIGAGDVFKAANIIGEHFGPKKEKR